VAITLVTFAAHGWDKYRAQTASSRVPEVTLHLLTLLGGTLGALAGRSRFHHKTRKQTFRVVFWAIVAFQAALVVAYLVLR
jgi:uncharacterized membrane protein YsdA (DUF1294 family)